MDADQRAELIRDLDKAARDAASHVAALSRKYRDLTESCDPDISPRDAVAVEDWIRGAMDGLSGARRVFGRLARLLDGPLPPPLMLRATDEPGHLDIIARYPDADLLVGRAVRTGIGEDESWHLRLTDADRDRDRPQGSIGLHHPATAEELLEALGRFVDDHGPWWTREEGSDG
jgi:hypothetical protein